MKRGKNVEAAKNGKFLREMMMTRWRGGGGGALKQQQTEKRGPIRIVAKGRGRRNSLVLDITINGKEDRNKGLYFESELLLFTTHTHTEHIMRKHFVEGWQRKWGLFSARKLLH